MTRVIFLNQRQFPARPARFLARNLPQHFLIEQILQLGEARHAIIQPVQQEQQAELAASPSRPPVAGASQMGLGGIGGEARS